MTNDSRDDRKQDMLRKVRKLLAMGRDGRGNATECDTAMRQANKLMAEFGISEAEADMKALTDGEMVFGEAQSFGNGNAPTPGVVHKSMPTWAKSLALCVAGFCDCVVNIRETKNGNVLVFAGERDDVLMARWLLGALGEQITREYKASGWSGAAAASEFKRAAVGALYVRLRRLTKERMEAFAAAAASGSRALMVVDQKALMVKAKFGAQRTRNTAGYSTQSGASIAGREAGSRINIPSGKPVGTNSHTAIR